MDYLSLGNKFIVIDRPFSLHIAPRPIPDP